MRNLYLVLGALVSFSCVVSANKLAEDKHFRDLEKQSVKCSVVLVGGKSTILRYYNLPTRDRNMLESEVKAKGVSAGNKHYAIHKVKECINLNKDFKDAISRQLDISTTNNG